MIVNENRCFHYTITTKVIVWKELVKYFLLFIIIINTEFIILFTKAVTVLLYLSQFFGKTIINHTIVHFFIFGHNKISVKFLFAVLFFRQFRICIRQIGSVDPKLWRPALPMEQVTGIEPAYSAWEADTLPLSYTCIS